MKLFLTILTIILMVQISLAASVGRFKRSYAAKQNINSYVVKFEDWLERTHRIAKVAVKDIPDTEEYYKYREDWLNFIEMYDNEKAKIDGCLYKLYGIMNSLSQLFAPYHNVYAPAEAKEVKRLFYTHGFKELEDEIKEFMKTFDPVKIKQAAAQLTEAEAMEFLSKCS